MSYIIAAVLFAGALAGTAYQSFQMGKDSIIAAQAKENKIVEDTREQARLGAADAIAKIDIKQVTIQGRLQKEISTNTVYRDCVTPANGLRALNDALTNTDSGPSSGSELPQASRTK